MEYIKLEFSARILRILPDGFNAILEDGYLMKFRDSQAQHNFEANDRIIFTIGNINKDEGEEIFNKHSVIYGIITSFISNGFLFKSVNEKSKFFWSTRGMITHKRFEKDDLFEHNSLVKIEIGLMI